MYKRTDLSFYRRRGTSCKRGRRRGQQTGLLDGPLSVDVQSAGLNCEGQEYIKLQATITEQVGTANFDALEAETKAILEGPEHWSFKQQ